jgi:hypothetical protein
LSCASNCRFASSAVIPNTLTFDLSQSFGTRALSVVLAAAFRQDTAGWVDELKLKALLPQSTTAFSSLAHFKFALNIRRPRLGSCTYYIPLSDRPFVPLQSAPWPSTRLPDQEKVFKGHALMLPGG